MKKVFISLLLGTALLCQAAAQNTPLRHHEWRLGWGDMLFETLAFHQEGSRQKNTHNSDFGYTGHIFLEYRYHLNRVVSLGIQTDFEGIFWNETPVDMYRQPTGPSVPIRNYDLSILPTVRLNCLNTDWVRLYGGFAAGLLMAFDNAKNMELAPAFNITVLGVQVGKGPWSGSLELGPMISLRNANAIYMFGSRLISVSVNYSW